MPVSAATRDELKTMFGALRDRVLDPGDAFYVANVNCHGRQDAVSEIATEIDFQDGGGVCLFTGQRGTGKSTELQRLKKQLEDLGAVVFYADLFEYLLLSKEVEISDFLVSVAGAFSDQVHSRYQASPGERSYWDRFTAFLQTEVVVKEVGTSLGGVQVKAALKSDPDFKRRVQEASRGHVATLVQQAHDFFIEAVSFVREREGRPDLKVVLLVDSVERIRGVGPEAMPVYESVRNLFFGHAEHLRVPMLHIVYTIPPYLSVLAPGAGTLMGGAVARRLVSTHIFKDRSREQDPAGLAVMREVIARRHGQWAKVFEPAALDQLALSSGGDLREFFRLIKLCLTAVRDDADLPLNLAAAKVSESVARGEMLPIPADHLGWLRRISLSHDTCLEKDADLPTLANFLDNRLVLNYRNGSDWYDVHPLLRDIVDAHVPAAATAST